MAKLVKVSGAGNHFFILDLRSAQSRQEFTRSFGSLNSKARRRRLAREVASPHESFGADGVLFLEESKIANVKWDFYNADGSSAEMCGNAARCVGRYLAASENGILAAGARRPTKKSQISYFSLETVAGIVKAEVLGSTLEGTVRVEMPTLQEFEPGLSLKIGSERIAFDFVNSGVPHAVVERRGVRNGWKGLAMQFAQLQKITDEMRRLPRFRKASTNVTFFVKKSSNSIESLTFERGVGGFTLACGTGAVAAATAFAKGLGKKVQVRVPGGRLEVDSRGARPILVGPAKIIGIAEVL